MGQLTSSGHELTPHPSDADVIVVNTCSFIDPAKQESVDTILEMAEYKKTGRAQRLIVAGCLVERYRDDIKKNMPEVDSVIGTNELDNITALCEGVTPKPNPFDAYLYHDATPRVLSTPKHFAYIKIAEGCDHPCTFCIIPQLRGKFRSRRFESVVAEAEQLVANGVKELVLIGQDTTCYGEDLGLKDGLATLLERLAQIENVHWVRFLYAYPNKITGRLLETIAANPKICSYIDVPLQHASPDVLKRMKRGAGAEIFLRSIEKMRNTIPGLTLRTSFIVGFPGETEQDFEVLCGFVRQTGFDWLGVFSYSDEEGSPAHHVGGKVPAREIEQRRRTLMKLQQQISRKKKSALIGRHFDLLVSGPAEDTDLLWEGRTEMHAPEIDGKVYVNDLGDRETLAPGEMVRCEITEAHDYDLIARIVG